MSRTRPAAAPSRRERRASERSSRRHGAARRSIWSGPLPYVAAVVVIAGAIVYAVLGRATPAATPAPAAATAIVASVTSIPADVFDRVGAGVADPLKATSFEVQRGPSGKPLVLYVGAEYCPFCASEKWSVVAALSRFGTFQGLELSTSSSSDVFPDTPTITFRKASFQSEWIDAALVETGDRQGNKIADLSAQQDAAMQRSDPQGSIPFLSIAERYVAVGSGYRPDVLTGKTWQQIADAMRDPTTPIARGAIGNANWITARICEQTGGQPAAVCASPAVRSLSAK